MHTNNLTTYYQFCKENINIPLFFQPYWLNAVKQNKEWDVAISYSDNGNIRGVMPYFIGSDYGMSSSLQATLTAYSGPYLIYPDNMTKANSRYNYQFLVTEELISQLPKVRLSKFHFLPEMTNWMPFNLRGYRQSTRYTYRIAPNDCTTIKNNFKPNVRNKIKHANKKFTVDTLINIDVLYNLNQQTFARKNKPTPFCHDLLKKIIIALQQNDCVKMYTAYNSGIPCASIMIPNDKHHSYCLLMGIDKELCVGGAVQLLLWNAIKDASQENRIFDFEGSMIPEVEPVFRSFGGVMTPYHVVSKCNRWLAAIFNIWKGYNF